MKISKIGIVSTVIVLALAGCGSSGDDSKKDENGGASQNNIQQSVAYSDCVFNFKQEGKTYVSKLGANGHFKVECSNYGDISHPELALKNENASFTISKMTSEGSVDMVVADGEHLTATVTSDYAIGEEHLKGSGSKHGSFDCVNTYSPTVPATIASIYDFEDIKYFDDETMSSTTCPEWVNDDDSLDDENPQSFLMIQNYKIIDTDDVSSKIAEYNSLK